MELEDAIRFPGYVPDHDLVAFYQKAAAYVFPSLSEGFGLPPLEAMLYGTPVVSSNATCLPEILQTPRSMWILTIPRIWQMASIAFYPMTIYANSLLNTAACV